MRLQSKASFMYACAILLCIESPFADAMSPGTQGENVQGAKVVVRKVKNTAGQTLLKGDLRINAPPALVWQAVHKERQVDPELTYCKVVTQTNENECTLEEKFSSLPIVGTAVCLLSNVEVPLERIDYKLIKSDRFKAMEGSWAFSSCDNGQATNLELSSYIDPRLPIPRSIVNASTSCKIQRRLRRVKSMAELLNHKSETDRCP